MSQATITPLTTGEAVFELNGMTHKFTDWSAAVAESRRLGIRRVLAPFPPMPVPTVPLHDN